MPEERYRVPIVGNGTPRERATALIADKLGIRPEEVTDSTSLGDAWHVIMAIAPYVVPGLTSVIGNFDMTAGDLFRQIKS